MTDNTAKDGRPDVEIKLKAYPNADPRIAMEVAGEAHCRFCTDTMMSADPRTLVNWADWHESSQGHILAKQEALEARPRQEYQGQTASVPRDEADSCNCGTPFNHTPACNVSIARAERALRNRRPIVTPWSSDDLPYPPTHPKGQHGLDQVVNPYPGREGSGS